MGLRLIHERVRELIDERGLHHRWVATKVGLSPDRFSHILDGRRPVPEPHEDFYRRLSELLGVPESALRPEAEEPVAV